MCQTRAFLVVGEHLRLGRLGRRERGLLRREQRIGERLRQAQLPARGRLAQRQPHAQRTCAGPQTLLAPLRQAFRLWFGVGMYRDSHRAYCQQAFTRMVAKEVWCSHACKG